MSKLNIKIGSKVQANVRKQIEEAIQDEKLLTEVGTIARNDIVASIVAAKEPATGAAFADPTITEMWRERKKKLSATNKPFDAASGGGTRKARLIFTGQWIQSIMNRIVKSDGRNVVEIGPTGTHQPYTGLNGQKMGKPIPNKELGEYLKEQGRDWTGVPDRTRKRLVTAVRNFLRRKLTTRNN